jgi:predicted anti-sigma-YlaC factor YlaD
MKHHPSQWIASGLTCRSVTDRTSDCLDARLSVLMKVRVVFHLASCADCRAYVKQMALVRDTMAFLPKPLPSPINRLRLRHHFARCHAPSQ